MRKTLVLLVCIGMYWYVSRMYSYVSVCSVCYSYVTRMYSCGVLVMIVSQHPPPFLFDGKSRTTRIIAWEFAQLSTLVKMRTCDWLSVNPRGNTGSRRRSKNNLRGITMGIGPV